MKSISMKILKYFSILLITILILVLLLIVVASIPKEKIIPQLNPYLSYFNKKVEIKELQKRRDYTFLHPYADSILLNIIYCLDENKPLTSIMEAKYYSQYEAKSYYTDDVIKTVENGLSGNTQYIRYWHGSILLIKPLLMIFNIMQIYVFNFILLIGLIITLSILLIKKKHIALFFAFIIALLMTAFWIVPLTLEYTWMYLLMIIVTIISILIEKNDKNNQKLYMLFCVTGVLTCFFDFLTTETLTILVPLIFVISIRYQEKRITLGKDTLIFIIKSLTLWGISYCLMWLIKWGLASIVLNINAFNFVTENALIRVNGKISSLSTFQLYTGAITKNILALFPINIIKKIVWLWIPFFLYLLIELIIIDWKNKEKMRFMQTMLFLAILPYIRYLILANHSYKHYFFTFRSQFATILCIILILIYTADKEKLFSKVKLKKKTRK